MVPFILKEDDPSARTIQKVYLVYTHKCGFKELVFICFEWKIQPLGNNEVQCTTPSSLSSSD